MGFGLAFGCSGAQPSLQLRPVRSNRSATRMSMQHGSVQMDEIVRLIDAYGKEKHKQGQAAADGGVGWGLPSGRAVDAAYEALIAAIAKAAGVTS
jgi:hypothetical protein